MRIFGDLCDRHVVRAVRAGPREPVLINSCGGGIRFGRALYDVLNGGDHEGLVLGECNSAAFLPLLACHRRFALPNCTFLLHPPHTSYDGPSECQALANDVEDMRIYCELVAAAAGRQEWFDLLRRGGRVFTTGELVNAGVLDPLPASKKKRANLLNRLFKAI